LHGKFTPSGSVVKGRYSAGCAPPPFENFDWK
jgi:hypothetical protein